MQRFAGKRNFDVIFDVGANIGQTAWEFVRYFPGTRTYCFEPSEASFKILKQRYGAKVHCIPKALGATVETRALHTQEHSERNTFVADAPDGLRYDAPEAVQVTTVDSFCAEQEIDAIDILKMDVQGWEIEVLRGASRMMKANRVRFVFSEVAFSREAPDMVQFVDLHKILEEKRFRFCGLYDNYRWRNGAVVHFANALYVDPDFVR
ncbi:MAG: FkbM family methyltransferase [Reyranella sp.]|nr:FkbM family methyltransferase [Reyranella sp.]